MSYSNSDPAMSSGFKAPTSTSSMTNSIIHSMIASTVANMAGTVSGHPLDTIRVSIHQIFLITFFYRYVVNSKTNRSVLAK